MSAQSASKPANRQKQANRGSFQKGRSGNPSGRPKLVGEVRDLARAQTDMAIRTLVEVATNDGAPPAARVSAAQALLDRGWGKAAQPIVGDDGHPPVRTARELSDAELAAIASGVAHG